VYVLAASLSDMNPHTEGTHEDISVIIAVLDWLLNTISCGSNVECVEVYGCSQLLDFKEALLK